MRRTWGDDGAIACCVSPMLVGKQMQFFGARANLAKCLLYAHQRRPRRDQRQADRAGVRARAGRRTSTSRTWCARFDRMMDWLAEVYVDAMNVIHYMHDKYAYERLEMALHDYAPLRTMAFGMAGLSVVADSLSAIKFAKVQGGARRERAGDRLPDRGDVPALRQQRQPRRPARRLGRQRLHEQAAQAPDLPQRDAHAVDPDDHVERRLRQGHRQHAGRPAAGRAVRARRQPDARARQPRHPRVRGVGGEDPVPRCRGRHLADRDAGAGRARPHGRGPRHQPDVHPRRVLQRHGLPHEHQRARTARRCWTRWSIPRSIRA